MATESRPAQGLLLLQGAELPMWRYIDPAGACQGPFESMEMMKWFEGSFLKASLLICGTVGDNECWSADQDEHAAGLVLCALVDMRCGNSFYPAPG